MVKIKEIPENDRPIERLIEKGPNSLSDEEILAILLKTGTKDYSSKELASILLKEIQDIRNLKNINFEQLLKIKGIKQVKAATLMASIELAKRLNQEVDSIKNKKANNPELLFDYYKNTLSNKTQEHFYAVYLDANKNIISDKLLFIGTINYSMVHPRDIFKEAYNLNASSIILVHNHPTGNVLPSKNDIDTTNNLIKVGELLGIKILDHIIIGKKTYYSFYENKDI